MEWVLPVVQGMSVFPEEARNWMVANKVFEEDLKGFHGQVVGRRHGDLRLVLVEPRFANIRGYRVGPAPATVAYCRKSNK